MLRLWLHISRRWLIIYLIIFFSTALGFFNIPTNEQLFLRNTSDLSSNKQAVKGDASKSARLSFINYQIEEVSIGVRKVDLAQAAPVKIEQAEWGRAKQLDEHTWTIKVGEDEKIGTAQEILVALNNYRQRNGRGGLSWDDNLANYAQSRAVYFNSITKLDGHAGFSDYINNQDGFHKLGFMSLGENSSYGYTLEAVHLIEWVYAGDKPHDDNQLDSKWSHVGIGVSGTATDLVFAGNKF